MSCSESLSLFIFLSQKTLVYFKSDHPYQILLLSFFDDSLPCSEKDLSCKLFLFCFTELSRLHYQHMYFSVLVQNSEKKNQRLSPLSLVLVFFVQINFPMFPLQCSPLIVGKGQAGSEEDLSCTKSTAGYLILYFLNYHSVISAQSTSGHLIVQYQGGTLVGLSMNLGNPQKLSMSA